MASAPRYDRPGPGEYAAFYAGYIARVPDGDLLLMLSEQGRESAALFRGVPAPRGDFAYAPGKWTLKEVIGHVADAERGFAYRALRIPPRAQTPPPSFDERAWVPQSGAGSRTLADLTEELGDVRRATLSLLTHLPADAPLRRGTASGWEVSVRALAWIIAGHERHHLGIIRERYL